MALALLFPYWSSFKNENIKYQKLNSKTFVLKTQTVVSFFLCLYLKQRTKPQIIYFWKGQKDFTENGIRAVIVLEHYVHCKIKGL